MSNWIPLRVCLAEHVDEQIAAEPDREARALLAYHRERVSIRSSWYCGGRCWPRPAPMKETGKSA
jgi:hypothetical protein